MFQQCKYASYIGYVSCTVCYEVTSVNTAELKSTMHDSDQQNMEKLVDHGLVVEWRVVGAVERSGLEKDKGKIVISSQDTEGVLEGCANQNQVMLHCAQNITHWWWIEHFKRQKGNNEISFPGEVVMPQGLMPLALWLGIQEYGGIWRHGGGEDRFEGHE